MKTLKKSTPVYLYQNKINNQKIFKTNVNAIKILNMKKINK